MDKLAASHALLWDPQVMPKRGPRPTLDFESIAWAGIEIADKDGLAGLTMQRVAEQLGVTKMALYRYVPGKAELVALMVDVGVGPPPAAGPTEVAAVDTAAAGAVGNWRMALDRWSRELFERFRQHPWSLEATLGIRAIGPNELGWTEAAVAALSGIGLTGGEILDVAVTLVGHVRNLAQQLIAIGATGDGPDHVVEGAGAPTTSETAMDASLSLLLRGREAQYPALAAALSSAAQDDEQNQALEFGLGLILDGVQQLLAARR